MGTVNANFLPASTGLSLGSSNQEWNAWLNLLNSTTPVNMAIAAVAYVATPTFTTSSIVSVFTMTLSGNVTSSTLSSTFPGILIFQLTEDAVGGRTFVWPTNFKGADIPDPTANAQTTQVFFYDGTNAWPLAPQVVFP